MRWRSSKQSQQGLGTVPGGFWDSLAIVSVFSYVIKLLKYILEFLQYLLTLSPSIRYRTTHKQTIGAPMTHPKHPTLGGRFNWQIFSNTATCCSFRCERRIRRHDDSRPQHSATLSSKFNPGHRYPLWTVLAVRREMVGPVKTNVGPSYAWGPGLMSSSGANSGSGGMFRDPL